MSNPNREVINRLIALKQEYPDLPILPMIDSDVVQDAGYAWWTGSFSDVTIEEVISSEAREEILIREEVEEEFIEEVLDDLIEENGNNSVNDVSEAEYNLYYALAEKIVNDKPWTKVIAVRVTIPDFDLHKEMTDKIDMERG